MKIIIYIFIFIVISFIYYCHGERTRDKMYAPITGASCIRRLNATHQTGCTSARQGSVGALHALNVEGDLDFVLNSGSSPPYTVLMPPNLFVENIMQQLKDSERIAAVLLVNNSASLDHFSTESRCPNQFIGISSQHCDASDPLKSWNPLGSNLMHEDFPFPILFISDKEQIKLLYDCFEKFNHFDMDKQFERSLCSVELSSFMAAAVNSEVCHRRSELSKNLSPVKFCDPLGDKNIFASLFPRNYINSSDNNPDESINANNTLFEYKTELNGVKLHTDDNSIIDKFTEKKFKKSLTKNEDREKVILLVARLDTTSMFDGIAPGAMDSLLSFVTLMNTAHILNQLLVENKTRKSYDKNILYLLLNGESYDYIGSQRLLYDIDKSTFPPKQQSIDFEDIDMIIEIGSLGGNKNFLTSHYIESNLKIENFLQNLKSYSTDYDFNISLHSSNRLPPSSVQTFVANKNIRAPAMVLTDFDDKFVNHFYHSIYDDSSNIRYQYHNSSSTFREDFTKLMRLDNFGDFSPDSVQVLLRNISTLLAMTLYQEVSNNSFTGELGANLYLIDELLHCYLESADCPAFRAASPPNKNKIAPLPPYRYVGVAGYINDATIWTARVLAFLTSSSTNRSEDDCDYLPYSWVTGFNGSGVCIRTHANYSEAVSPAFLDDDYEWSSGRYSTWTESTWRDITARMFLRPSVSHEIFTLGMGVFVLIVSFCIVWVVDQRSDILFNGHISEQGVLLPGCHQ